MVWIQRLRRDDGKEERQCIGNDVRARAIDGAQWPGR